MKVSDTLQGALEILLPGLFFFLNLLFCTYWWTDPTGKVFIKSLADNAGQSVIIAVPVGYCLGMVLRLLRTRHADHWSGIVLRWINPGFALKGDRFPYPKLTEKRLRDLPPEARTFYEQFWTPSLGVLPNHTCFDFYKTILSSIDPKSAPKMDTAEALCRYVANTVYALVLSWLLLLALAVQQSMFAGSVPVLVIPLICVYFIAMMLILWNFRYLRIAEVERVFSLAFHHRRRLMAGSLREPTPQSAPLPSALRLNVYMFRRP